MEYEVTTFQNIDFGATGVKEVLQNISFILSTMVGSCPMDREFGWIPDLDSPIQLAQATNVSRIIQAINENEPRATVEEVRIESDPFNGKIKPIVRVIIDESI